MNRPKRFLSILAFAAALMGNGFAADRFVSFDKGDFKLCSAGDNFSIRVGEEDNVAVKLAAKNLATDLKKVCHTSVNVTSSADGCRIVAATMGSGIANELAKKKVFDAKQLRGKTEKYLICTGAGGDNTIYIIGSDRRGTVYGIYELSRQIGVSPWYYWMDTPIKAQKQIFVKKGAYTDGEPAVRYRGIFLNDEAPCLTSWVKNTFGTKYGDHRFYEKVFELVLRLKGNYIWPAMWKRSPSAIR